MNRRKYLLFFLFSLCLVSSLGLRVGATEATLSKDLLDVTALLPGPALGGSEESLAELSFVRKLVAERTPADEKLILSEEWVCAATFSAVIGVELPAGKYPKLDALMKLVEKTGGPVIREAKKHWSRPRPFMTDPSIKPIASEKTFSYPSGHGTRGELYALVLAELFPEHREALLEKGRAIGWHRVLAGVHYPSDIQAGRVLGLAIFDELMREEAFRNALTEVRAELTSAVPARS